MLKLETLKVGDRIRSVGRFGLAYTGTVVEIDMAKPYVVIKPDDYLETVKVFAAGFFMYERVG